MVLVSDDSLLNVGVNLREIHNNMPYSYYPPTNEGRALFWENILSPDAQAALTALDFSAATLASIQADAAMAIYIYRSAPQAYEAYATSMNGWGHAYLDSADGTPAPLLPVQPVMPAPPTAVKGGIEARRAAWVQTAKNAPGYDASVQGVTLRIEAAPDLFVAATYQASIFGLTSPASATVTVKFRKAAGRVDAMSFSGRKSGELGWTELGRYMATPASLHIPITTPGQPEQWEIVGRAYVKDSAIGIASSIETVLVRG